MNILVTGCNGYIGGQTALQLHDQGHHVYGVDTQDIPNHLQTKTLFAGLRRGDFADPDIMNWIAFVRPQAVIHCAGTSLVGPSIANPALYYENNFIKTKRFCDFLLTLDQRPRLIFSSSAATYGNPIMTPCQEVDPTEPISPYGESKLMIEWLLKSYHRAHGLDYVAFRYFNACGADPHARHGQPPGATHIIARVLESMRDQQPFTLYGDQYETPDGTCVRDYVHVADIAQAHILAVNPDIPAGIYNLGTNGGASNREIISTAEAVTGESLTVNIGPIREGDPAMLTASADKFARASGWKPQYALVDIIEHAWRWYNR